MIQTKEGLMQELWLLQDRIFDYQRTLELYDQQFVAYKQTLLDMKTEVFFSRQSVAHMHDMLRLANARYDDLVEKTKQKAAGWIWRVTANTETRIHMIGVPPQGREYQVVFYRSIGKWFPYYASDEYALCTGKPSSSHAVSICKDHWREFHNDHKSG